MKVFNLSFRKEVIENVVCIVEEVDLSFPPDYILSNLETEKYNKFKSDKGRIEYLLGRYASKIAYNKISGKCIPYESISIENGIFEQPILNSNFWDISISHAHHIGAGIIFDKKFPIGIDLERLNIKNIKLIQEKVYKEEIIDVIDQPEVVYLTVIWCLREAVSKAIKTGLTIPIDLLKLKKLSKVSNWFLCEFENFPQYYGAAQVIENYVFAIAHPMQLGHVNDEFKEYF